MKFGQFFEFAAFDFTLALRRVEKYIQQAKTVENNLGHPLYYFSKQKVGATEEVWMAYWEALVQFRTVIAQNLHDGNILKTLSPLYRKWRTEFERMGEQDGDARYIIDRNRITTNLFLVHEMVEDMVKGKSPEPD